MRAAAAARQLLTPAERRGALALLALMVLGVMLETLCTGLVIPAIALLMQQDLAAAYPRLQPLFGWLGDAPAQRLIVTVVLGLAGVFLVKNLFLAAVAWRQTRFVYGVTARLSQDLFAVYLRQPYTFHLQRNSAQLVRNVIGEVTLFSEAMLHGLTLVTEAMVLLAISLLLLLVEPVGTLAAAAVLGAAAAMLLRTTRASITRWGTARQAHDALRYQHLQQGLGGVKEVLLLGREEEFLARYGEHTMQSTRASRLQAAMPELSRLWLEFLAVAGIAVLAIAMLAHGRPLAAIVPTLALFAVAAFRLLPAVHRIVHCAQSLRYYAPVIATLRAEFALAPGAASPERGETAHFRSDIRLSDVEYTYPGAPAAALAGVTLAIRKGECVGFAGPSGSGKSTLVDVVLGLLTPQRGQVRVDGEDIRADLRRWQNQVGYVPQSIYLTDDSLRRNVAFGIADAQVDEARVRQAIREAQLEAFVASLPAGLETVVGERGVRLSGGQRQRIGIARALYHDPAVLVLDEATSALDPETESELLREINALKGRKTLLIVAHRLSTMAGCDRLYHLEGGRIAERSAQAAPAIRTAAT